jgi:cytochrome P450
MINPGFRHERYNAYAETMVRRAEALAARWEDGGTIDLGAEMVRLTLEIAVDTLFGDEVTPEEALEVGQAFTAISRFFASAFMMMPVAVPEWVPLPGRSACLRAIAALGRSVGRIIARRRERPGGEKDLLGLLLSVRDEQGRPLEEREVADQVMTFFLAAHETTTLALTYSLFLLGRHPEQERRLLEEVDALPQDRLPGVEDLPRLAYTTQVIKETLRLYPPAYALSREPVAETTLAGQRVEPGMLVVLPQWCLHRDERFFPQPEAFLPERFSPEQEAALPRGAYFPFGLGQRMCIGTRFSLMELPLVIATLLRRFRLQPLEEQLPPLQAAFSARPEAPVRVRTLARNRAAS